MKLVQKKLKDILKRRIPFVAKYKNLGEQYIVSAKVHLDESTPHLHIVFIPVVHKLDKKSGKQISKIACSEFWKGKDSYKQLQDSFYKYMTERNFDLERGKSTNIEHLSTEKFKQVTEYERIKEELNTQSLEQLETKNLDLIVAQNKQLIQYNKKLKSYLVKSFKSIERVTELQEENNDLRCENQELKRENYKLSNYIEKTFEVVKLLFDFPVNRLKSIVDNFINSKNKTS